MQRSRLLLSDRGETSGSFCAGSYRKILLLLLAAALAGCDGDGVLDVAPTAQIRLFNAVTNLNDAYPGDAIDILVDSSAAPPGAAELAFGTATDYMPAESGVRAFYARLSGDERAGGPENLLRFVPRYQAVGGFSYTLVLAGVVPESGISNMGEVAPIYVADDAFPPSQTADGDYNARIKLLNAAPYTLGGTDGRAVYLYLTPGRDAAPASVAELAERASAQYRGTSDSVESAPGTYHVTVANALQQIVAQETLPFPSGAARTLVLISTSANPEEPSPANHRLVTLTDADF